MHDPPESAPGLAYPCATTNSSSELNTRRSLPHQQ